MSLAAAIVRLRRAGLSHPRQLIWRATRQLRREHERWLAPRRQRRLDGGALLRLARAPTVDDLWQRLRLRPYPAFTSSIDAGELDRLEPGEVRRIEVAAEAACRRIVDLLGSGPVQLGSPIDWAFDYRAQTRWPAGFAPSIDFINRDRPSDIKLPWELSRLQWLIPAGQAYLLTGDERYAAAARDVLDEWIAANPLDYTVNWIIAMEAALRLLTWSWLFHVFAGSAAWSAEGFRVRFLSTLYLHGDFTRRNLERAAVAGNHYTAGLAGLAFAGLFFGEVGDAGRWANEGWRGLLAELPRQVHPDGVDFEASCAYHRLVFELFLWPALYRAAAARGIPPEYAARLRQMARFTAAYSRPDGSSPMWGDADDARALPLGSQALGDHRYLVGVAAIALGDTELACRFSGPRSELAWIFGPERAAALPAGPSAAEISTGFPYGGCYVMRGRDAHVFIDCGPVGLAGRGGHGHNDALSFEAWFAGVPVVIDCGSHVYTASFASRNRFRSTDCHNTPCVDGQEINRFLAPDDLWGLRDDARPVCLEWRTSEAEDLFRGMHRGYERLGVGVRRTIRFDKRAQSLEILDELQGGGRHDVAIPLHLAPRVSVDAGGGSLRLNSAGRCVDVIADGDGAWTCAVEPCAVSPSYGVALEARRLIWRRRGPLPTQLRVRIQPALSR